MPQPITKIVKDPYVKLDVKCLSTKPDLAILVCNIFAIWAKIEQYLSVMLVTLLGADANPALAIYSTLIAQHLQLGAVDAAAKASLSKEDYEIFRAAMSVPESAQTPRNHLAHWSWGICKERDDLLILADPKMLSERDIRVMRMTQGRPPEADMSKQHEYALKIAEANLFDNDGIIAYSKSDLERSLRDLEEASKAVSALQIYLDQSVPSHIGPSFGLTKTREEIRAEALEALNGQRLFREALDRIRKDQKTSDPQAP